MPAKCTQVALCFELGGATVVVPEDQLSLAIGKHGQNVRLAARLTDWDIDILTPEEYNQEVERLTSGLKDVEGLDDTFIDKLIALGIISVLDLAEIGAEPLINEIGLQPEMAEKVIHLAEDLARKQTSESAPTIAESLLVEQTEKTKPQQDDNP